MKTFTDVPRETVTAIFLNKQRAVLDTSGDELLIGDVVRFVSDEPDPKKRMDCLRAVSHQFRSPHAAGVVLSLRPLTTFEKDALK